MNSNYQLKIIQWNARGLNKSRLSEFKTNLDTLDPTLVLLSETHWSNKYLPSFSNYNLIFKNRPRNTFGGVAILVKKKISYVPLTLPDSNNYEAVGLTLV